MPEPLSLRAYARRRKDLGLEGVSPEAVSKAVASGRLSASVTRVNGQPAIADPELADREWAENTRRRVDALSNRADFGPLREQIARFGEVLDPDADQRPRVADADAPRIPRPAASLPDGVPPYNVSQAVRAQAAARREVAAAARAELELAELEGRLVDAATADADVIAHISMAKTRLLGVPSQLGQQLPHLAAEVVPVAERLIRGVLEELALDGRGA